VAKPETLCGIKEDKQVAVKEIIDAGDYDQLLERLREQRLASFGREKIGKKFGVLGSEFGIKQEPVFGGNAGLAKLEQIFEKRNQIIHHGARPFSGSQEVEEIMEFFKNLVFQLSFEVSRVYLIPVDCLGYYAAWMPTPPGVKEGG
jgi:hypothetical protein